jgi:glucose-6-phosphate-specific signal transduction histidine kinase
MTIADNGIGLAPTATGKPGSFGLIGIEERVKILGGAVEISGSPGAGTRVAVTVPLLDHDDIAYLPRAPSAPAPAPVSTEETQVGLPS